MSYNISRWTTKELQNFRIPVDALAPVEDYLDKPTLNLGTDTLSFSGRSEGFTLTGKIVDGFLMVETIKNRGEASGTMQAYLNEQIFPHSTGTLIAVCIWENGDSITRLTVRDGVVVEEGIEL